MENSKRTVTCGELRKSDSGKTVVLNGWVHRNRLLGGLSFILLRDRYGLTQAALEGRKTMTRRIIKLPYGTEGIYDWTHSDHSEPLVSIRTKDGKLHDRIPSYQVGEEVAIAQSYKSIHEEMMNGDYGEGKYDAFRSAMVAETQGWNNKMFVRADLMPHAIRITGIKVERLQDISKEDCLKEGIDEDFGDGNLLYWWSVPHEGISWAEYRKRSYELSCHEMNGVKGEYFWDSPQKAFAALIDKISGKGTWESNPWVFVYTFELID